MKKHEQLSPHFYRDEFACHGFDCCNESSPVHPDLVNALERLRIAICKPITIISGFRCRKHNSETLGAAPDSYHCKGMAADISVRCFDPAMLAAEAGRIETIGGIKTHSWGIHIDVGPRRKI